MNPILRNILAVIAAVFIGSFVNMGIIMLSGSIIPPPEGVDNTTMEGLKASMHLFEPKHYIMPFLAHAMGTLAGALIVVLLAANHHLKFALGIAGLFFIGGAMMAFELPSPMWFNALDLIVAYFPMGYLATRLIQTNKAR